MTEVPDDALVIGLGGNIGEEAAITERFVRAREALAQLGATRSASLYRTAPVGPAQAAFLNTAVRVTYGHGPPGELVATVLELERLLGRDRRGEARWGPRMIDLDVLVWGRRVVDTPELVVPHPRLAYRRFALAPIADLFGEDVVLPTFSEPVGALLSRVADQSVEWIAVSTWHP